MRRATLASGVIGAAVAAVAILHVPAVHRSLAARGAPGGAACPFGYGAGARPVDLEARRARAAPLRGPTAARARPALGFTLDATTAADVTAWAVAHDLRCDRRRGGMVVECTQVPGALVPGAGALAATAVWFELGPSGRLASIKTVRRDPAVAAVASAFTAAEHAVTARAGAPVRRDGSAAPELLARGALRQAMVEYRFTDYRAVLRATNLGDGFVLTEEYATLVE